ncbi:diguanylate cyclase [Piscinibacter gummiphilus]|uniref:diguanylate cyclase n=1 Tax=Piscinibacter gummiphilus TaxID=946333 RepID=UPI000A26F5A1|nr:diguanylate cyclase [Piscinibacter gummiphilus]ATU63868.1 GGDEF domain-containing protein [Piscinibacter gummiphilus]GLS93185.1 hypothetical protein GCM10007918_04760 [Piscinibacter gummiphilus]
MHSRRARSLLLWCLAFLIGGLLCASGLRAQPVAGRALVLDGSVETVDAWSAATLRFDATRSQTLDDVLADPAGFKAPASDFPTFGVRKDALWVRVPLDVRCQRRCPWVLDIDYTAISYVDVFLLTEGRLVQRIELGNLRPFADRPLGARSHAAVLDLRPGSRQELVLRIETKGAMIVPLSLNTPAQFHSRALNEQMLQGLLSGLGICLLLYSIGQGIGLRESLFLKYALMISGSIVFSLLQFGIGAQYLWTDSPWVETHIGPLSALIASVGSFLFIEQVLAGPDTSRMFSRVMKGGAVFAAATAAAYVAGVIDTRIVSGIVSILALIPVLMGIPGAVKRAIRGDQVGVCFLIAWAVYFFATAVMIMVINGRAPVNFWTLHSFQFGATVDMLLFMRVLGLRMKDIHTQARHATLERDAMRSLAHTDPLTGLPNRRGLNATLNAALNAALARSGDNRHVAVYMLDLDGFKPVNDRHGHDVGDELLIAVAGRLLSSVRRGDTVARLGGDEFVVMSEQLSGEDDALLFGERLLAAFATPFDIDPHSFRVGGTIGYALAPADATDAVTLLKFADAAMYLGKESGKGCIRRGGAAVLREASSPEAGLAWPQPPEGQPTA